MMSGAPGLIALIALFSALISLIRRKESDDIIVALLIFCISGSFAYWAFPKVPQKYESEVEAPNDLSGMIMTQIRRGEERITELTSREERLQDQLSKLVEIKRNLSDKTQDRSALERTQTLITKVRTHITRLEKTAHQLRDQIDTIKVQASVTIEGEDKGDARLLEMLKTADEVLVELSE
jgi:hypothetical protein